MLSTFSIGAAMTQMGPLARQNLFLFEINSVPGGGLPEDIRFSAETASVPNSKNDAMLVPWMNSEYKIPGITKYDNISVALRVSEQNNMRIYNLIYNWYRKIYDPFTGIQEVPFYTMTDAKISLLNYQGNTVKAWDVVNLFPLSCGGTALSRDNADKQVMTIEFAYTYATMSY
jgi:phage tail-like protein